MSGSASFDSIRFVQPTLAQTCGKGFSFWQCCEGATCEGCAVPPDEFTVVISGVVGGFCPDCASFNGTFSLPLGFVSDTVCDYRHVISTLGCGSSSGFPLTSVIILQLRKSGSNLLVYVELFDGATFAQFEATGAAAPADCAAISGMTLTKTAGPDFFCDGTAASVTVSAA